MKNVSIIALVLWTGAFLFQCRPSSSEEKEEISHSDMNERLVVYQMMTRLFGNTNTTNLPWGTQEQNGVGKFNDISSVALEQLKGMGYTHIWYTGVLEHAVIHDYTAYNIPLDDADVVKGRAGSPYAIKDYYDVNPDLAESVENRMEEFNQLVARTHDAGLKVVIDFVPNHVARDYRSDQKPEGVDDFGTNDDTKQAFSPQNNFYYIPGEAFRVPEGYVPLGENSFPTKDGQFDEVPAKASGNDVFSAQPSEYDWFETVKLNYGVDYQNDRREHFEPVPDTWHKMVDILKYWAAKGVDAFRCDMAEMVPVAFWNWAIRNVKNDYPNIIFIAEIYNPDNYRNYLETGGFDYLYDKVEMYDTLKNIVQGKMNTDAISGIWQKQEGIGDQMLRFLENHDEQRIASPDFAGNMWKGIPMMAVTAFMHRGPVMMYFGQDVGEPGAGASGFGGDDGRTTIFDYWGVPEHVKWVNEGEFDGGKLSEDQKRLQAKYVEILQAVNDKEALRTGHFYDLHYFNRSDAFTGYNDQIYAFTRHTENQALLVVVNFSEEAQDVRIKIPKDAWDWMDISGETKNIEGVGEITLSKVSDPGSPEAIEIAIPALDYRIIQLK
jgi:glycosidase